MAGTLIPLDRRPSPVIAGRRSSLLDAAKQGLQASFAVVGYKGRNWRLKHRSEETILRDDRNQPQQSLDVVIVGISAAISRQYFAKSYTEGDDQGPDCFSIDGIKPDPSAPRIQHPVCATCKWSQWGSRITENGKRSKMCQDTRRMAIVPLGDIHNEALGGPMLLRVPPMSLNNLATYADKLGRLGGSFEYVGTRIGFDYDVAYPRLTFEALGWLDDDQQASALEMVEHDLIPRMLNDPSVQLSQPVEEEPEGRKVYPLRGSEPKEPEPVEEPPEPTPQVGPGTQPPGAPPPAQQPEPPAPPQKTGSNPFQQAVKPVAPAAAAPARGRPRKAAAPVTQVEVAPSSMEEAIDSLLSDDNAA